MYTVGEDVGNMVCLCDLQTKRSSCWKENTAKMDKENDTYSISVVGTRNFGNARAKFTYRENENLVLSNTILDMAVQSVRAVQM